MARLRAADDFVAIRARMEELQQERVRAAREAADSGTSEPYPSPAAPIGQVVLRLLQKHRRQLR